MRSSLIFMVLLLMISFAGCKKGSDSVAPLSNPNIINGCEIIQVQVVETDQRSGQIHSYINSYQYDSVQRLIDENDGEHDETDHYSYLSNDCNGDHHQNWHSSAQGFVVSGSDNEGNYQYSYDGNGYLQLEIFTDSMHQGHDESYTKSYYWDGGNLSYTVKQERSQSSPQTTNYSYFTDKPGQQLAPSSWHKGRSSANLIKQIVVSYNGAVSSTDTYSYIFDTDGKVAQYTDLEAGERQTVYTLSYSCH